MMEALDLFSGLGGWAGGLREAGYDVTTLDIEPAFGCDITADVRYWAPPDPRTFRVVTASPPCERFSTLAFQRGHFALIDGEPIAQTAGGELARELVIRTLELVVWLNPDWFVIENPRALLRRLMPFVPGGTELERRTVWYCHYGEPVAKPTDLWGGFPPGFAVMPACHNRRVGHRLDCCCADHVAAPRGSRTGTQGPQSAAERAKVPHELALDFARATR
jgi:hypothetical protein